ncbi:MAG: hypothetical protein U1E77_11725 [Inhella sp.]
MPDFAAPFAALRELLRPHAAGLVLRTDTPDCYYLDTAYPLPNGQPLFFASVQIKKSYVSVYLMPVYVQPALLAGISPGLRKRMQGKSCFNFKTVEPELFAELAQLTADGLRSYREQGFV